MLVTSRETGRWVLPKGWAEKGLSGPELAVKEAFEEAGILGEVGTEPVGSYTYSKRLRRSRIIECKVDVLPMRVERPLDDWPERKQRKRQWFTLSQAAMAVEEGDLVILLLRLAAPESVRSFV
jgi:8-oxo-dGTP pyrophosphatase MutT (NUDIX family)